MSRPSAEDVVAMRRAGTHTWKQIGDMLGVTRARAQQMHRDLLDMTDDDIGGLRDRIMDYLRVHGPRTRRELGDEFGVRNPTLYGLGIPPSLLLDDTPSRGPRPVATDDDIAACLRRAASDLGTDSLSILQYTRWRESLDDPSSVLSVPGVTRRPRKPRPSGRGERAMMPYNSQ